jgi:hypothetical protein
MVDFHPGYSIGAVTAPLHSLNHQLKMIAKQLGTLSELHGALAAQVSISGGERWISANGLLTQIAELTMQQGNIVETLRQLEGMPVSGIH